MEFETEAPKVGASVNNKGFRRHRTRCIRCRYIVHNHGVTVNSIVDIERPAFSHALVSQDSRL